MEITALLWILLVCFPAAVLSHARLMSPPSRSSMWRVGFATRKNFNDNALYCGGMTIQWQKNGGKCGICGDPYDQPHPRDNEAGGKYGRGIISKRYLSGQVIEATVDVTTNHRGYFEFKLCPNNNPKKEATQECLDKYILKEAHGIGTRYYISDRGRGDITVKLQLPKGLTCSQCVFQWTYVAGNNWGMCEDGESRLGCGRQETFRGCADISIENGSDIFNFNEVVNKLHNAHPHKNRKFGKPKDSTGTKNTDYAYEVSRHARSNFTKPDIAQNPHHFQQGNNEFHHNKANYLPPHPQRSGKPKRDRPSSNGRNGNGFVNKRKFHKYDKRHFYQHLNHPTFHQNSSGAVIPKDNAKWPSTTGNSSTNNGQQHLSQSHHPGKTRKRSSEMDFFLSESSSASDDDLSMSGGFNLGGKRYKDFWPL